MGLFRYAVMAFLAVGLLAAGLWPLSIICLAVLVFAALPRGGKRRGARSGRRLLVDPRTAAAALLFALSVLAAAAGGTYSPPFFVACSGAVLFWPRIRHALSSSRLVPVESSILLRPSFMPFLWHGLAEVRPGSGDLSRSLSSYEGTLIFSVGGKVYAHFQARARDSVQAESLIVAKMRAASSSIRPGGAYLLPLGSESASEALSMALKPLRHGAELPQAAPEVFVTASSGGFMTALGAFSVRGRSGSPSVPGLQRTLARPLLWEALERWSRARKMPVPDSFSNLLESFAASKGEPIGDRFGDLTSGEQVLTVQSLSGEKMQVTAPQLRALVAVYS